MQSRFVLRWTCRISLIHVKFLDELKKHLDPLGEQERAILLALKQEEHAKRGLPFDGKFYIWDYRYAIWICSSDVSDCTLIDTMIASMWSAI